MYLNNRKKELIKIGYHNVVHLNASTKAITMSFLKHYCLQSSRIFSEIQSN